MKQSQEYHIRTNGMMSTIPSGAGWPHHCAGAASLATRKPLLGPAKYEGASAMIVRFLLLVDVVTAPCLTITSYQKLLIIQPAILHVTFPSLLH